MQKKQNVRADSAGVYAGLSTQTSQVRATIFDILCVQHKMFPPVGNRRTIGGHRKSCECHIRGPLVGLLLIIGDHRWTAIGFPTRVGRRTRQRINQQAENGQSRRYI